MQPCSQVNASFQLIPIQHGWETEEISNLHLLDLCVDLP